MRGLLTVLISFFGLCALGQSAFDSPFTSLGPPNSLTYTDLRSAVKDKENVYKLNLSGPVIEPKGLSKLAKLINLQVLAFNSNSISQLPSEISELRGLMYLSSRGNALTQLTGITSLANLMYLDLYGTRLDSLPREIAALRRLKVLHIHDNRADTMFIPAVIGQLSSLNDLTIYDCLLDTLPKEIGNLSSLATLSLTRCMIDHLPSSVGKLSNLRQLVLDNNKLSSVPKEIFKLKKLEYLSLKNNKLTRIPDEICFMKNLATLDLSGNPIPEYDIQVLKVLLPGCEIVYRR